MFSCTIDYGVGSELHYCEAITAVIFIAQSIKQKFKKLYF